MATEVAEDVKAADVLVREEGGRLHLAAAGHVPAEELPPLPVVSLRCTRLAMAASSSSREKMLAHVDPPAVVRQLGCAHGISSDGAMAAVSAVRRGLWLRRKRAEEVVVVACAARRSFRETLKVLEADIQHASVVNVASPEDIGLLEL